MATILDKIVEVKGREVERRKREEPIEALKERIQSLPYPPTCQARSWATACA